MRLKQLYLLLAACLFASVAHADEARLLRFPHINGNLITFTYAGDLYSVDAAGGTARKLTSHDGYEMFGRISPDGKMIAFTGQYDGNTEVFVMPAEGGEPKRLTFTATLGRDDVGDRMGPNNVVMGWTPDGKNILYRSRCYTFNDFTGQLFTIPLTGGMPTEVPMVNGGFSSFSPDGKKLAYNYIFREFRTWKRYEGGMADDIRIFDFNTKKSEKITDNPRQDIFPMWAANGDEIYFVSERDDMANLFVYNTKTKETKQITQYTDFDIKFPAIGGDQIVFEKGGYIYKLDAATKQASKVTVNINNDQVWSRPVRMNLSSNISDISYSPGGERVMVTARGDVFSVPAKKGITQNFTNSSTSHDKMAQWSPDGTTLAYISDKDGEFTIYLVDNLTGIEQKLLSGLKTVIFGYKWSPDSKKILWSEKLNTLNVVDVATKQNTEIEKSGLGSINSYNWSQDSKYITYVRPENQMNNIVIYNVADKKKNVATDGWYNVGSPNFSKDGKYLIFSSARTFNPTYGSTEFGHIYSNMNKIYILPLTKDAVDPFAPANDVVAVVSSTTEAAKDTKSATNETPLVYDFSNLKNRIIELPVTAGGYSNLHMIDKNVYFNRGRNTVVLNLETKKESDLEARLMFGANYKKVLASNANKYQVIDNIPTGTVKIDKPVDFSNVRKTVDYHEEWAQIYDETWRQMRDYFYAKNMHGVDWKKVYDKYKVLVPYVNHRSDLTYIIGEMIAELNVGHAYSANGEHQMPARVPMGLLGAKFAKDKSGYFKITKIIEGANWSDATRSPLTMPGLNINEGDFIIAVNGQSLKDVDNIYTTLIDQAGKIVELTVNTSGSENSARKVLVTPIENESQLYYYNWVESNIKKVNEATNGEVGYIHIPDMGAPGLNEFVKHYYPQLGKKALIIDDRGNGGGNVSPMIIEKLLRTPAYYTMNTNKTEGSVNPDGTFVGPKVLLVNEYSASDGDLFPYRFKHYDLGTVIGRKTWGGVVGYSGQIPVVDGGSIVTPSYAPYSMDGKEFIIEGRGVEPHIDLANDPYKEYMGDDEQLSKAIQVALEKLKTERVDKPAIPAFPDKSKKNQ